MFIRPVGSEPEQRLSSMTHTVGLFGLGHPELLILGSSAHGRAAVLNALTGGFWTVRI